MARIFTDFSLRSPACILRLTSLLKNAGFPLNIHFLIDERARAQTKTTATLMQKWLSVLLPLQPHGFLLSTCVCLHVHMPAYTCLLPHGHIQVCLRAHVPVPTLRMSVHAGEGVPHGPGQREEASSPAPLPGLAPRQRWPWAATVRALCLLGLLRCSWARLRGLLCR